MKFSIIVPVYNSQETLSECLTAISNSDYKNYEIIIVDDGSTDNSINIARNFLCLITSFKSNQGVAAARNRGALEAKNEILLFIDSDITIKKDSISKVIDVFLKNDNIVGVSGVYSRDIRYPNFLSQYKHIVAYYRNNVCGDINQDSFRASFMALKREIFMKYKFDESFKRSSIEDIELGRKLISQGYRFTLDKSNEVEHVKRFTIKKFFKNQYDRSKDLVKVYLNKKAYKFYLGTNRKNLYAKVYHLRVPISWLALLSSLLFLISQNYIFLFLIFFLLLSSIILEKDFLRYCTIRKGLIFTIRCILVYFIDGFVSGLGVLKGILESYAGMK